MRDEGVKRLAAVAAFVAATCASGVRAEQASSPLGIATRLEARMAAGDGVTLPDPATEVVRRAGTVDLARGNWPDAFTARAGETICVAVSSFTGNYEFFDETGECFYTLVPVLATTENWVAPFRHPEEGPFPDDDLYAPWRLVDVWFLSHAESAAFESHAESAENAEPLVTRHSSLVTRGAENPATNLCFTAFAFTETNLCFTAAWPTNESIPEATLDLYGSPRLTRPGWTLVSSHPVTTNPVSLAVARATLPWFVEPTQHVHDATCVSVTNIVLSPLDGHTVYTNSFWSCATNRTPGECGFFRLGTRLDTDGDGLSDAFETLVSLTDPGNADTDGDTMPDGWETSFGLDPFDPLDAIEDPDGDDIPNVYEFHNGCDPLVSDWDAAPKLVAGGTGWNAHPTLEGALAASTSYTIVEIAPGLHAGAGWTDLWLPAHPVLVAGRARMSALRHVGSGQAAFYFDEEQSPHTMFRSLDLELAGSSSFQTAFWLGNGSLYHGPGAAASFANIHVRLGSSTTDRTGWFVRHSTTNPVVLSSCSVDAAGAASARGVYAVDSPDLFLENCSFLNFPDAGNAPGYAVQFESTAANRGGASDPVSVRFENCLFDASFTNAWAFAPLTNGVACRPVMHCCIAPDFGPFGAERTGCIEADPLVLPSGHLVAGSPAVGAAGVLRFSGLDLDGDPRDSAPDIGADEFDSEFGADSDGDGLSNATEVFAIQTDPFRADTDGDGVPDGCEVSEGTDPFDRGNYCFSLSGSLVADLAGTNGVVLAIVSTNGGTLRVLSATRPSLPPGLSFSFPHLVVTNEPVLKVCLFVDANANVIPDDGESGQSVLLSLSGHETEMRFSFPNVTDDVDRDGIPDLWELDHGLSPTNALDSCSDPDGDGLVNLHEYWHGYDPWVADGSNTVLSILSRSIDIRLSGKNPQTDLCFYSNYVQNAKQGIFVRNPFCWASEIDLSCASPWNTGDFGNWRAGTLISPRHFLMAAHFRGPKMRDWKFQDPDGNVFSRRFISFVTITNSPALNAMASELGVEAGTNTDLCVCLLDSELPPSINPAKFLPEDHGQWIGSGRGLPILMLDQEEKAIVGEIRRLAQFWPRQGVLSVFTTPTAPLRSQFHEQIVRYDSGNPAFLVWNDDVVLLGCLWHGGSGDVLFCTFYLDDIQAAMNELCPGYSIQVLNMDEFPTIEGGPTP